MRSHVVDVTSLVELRSASCIPVEYLWPENGLTLHADLGVIDLFLFHLQMANHVVPWHGRSAQNNFL
eukprot:6196889-Pleurochrysis_carterae.AAC.6